MSAESDLADRIGDSEEPNATSPRKADRKVIRPVSWLGVLTRARLPARSSGMMGLRPPIQLRGSAGISPASRKLQTA